MGSGVEGPPSTDEILAAAAGIGGRLAGHDGRYEKLIGPEGDEAWGDFLVGTIQLIWAAQPSYLNSEGSFVQCLDRKELLHLHVMYLNLVQSKGSPTETMTWASQETGEGGHDLLGHFPWLKAQEVNPSNKGAANYMSTFKVTVAVLRKAMEELPFPDSGPVARWRQRKHATVVLELLASFGLSDEAPVHMPYLGACSGILCGALS